MTDALTLSQILARGIALEWYEGVAVVRGVIQSLKSQGLTNTSPDLDDILVRAAGDVQVVRPAHSSETVRRLGQLLHVTIGHADPPVQLRLIVSQAMSPNAVFGSLQEYDEALAYFDRPDRAAVLRALFERASAAADVQEAGTSDLTLNTVAPLLPSAPAAAKRRKSRRGGLPAVAAGAMVLFAVSLRYVGANDAAVLNADTVSLAGRRVSASVGAALLSGLSAVTERVGLGRLVVDRSPEADDSEPAGGRTVTATPVKPERKIATAQAPPRSSNTSAVPSVTGAAGRPAAPQVERRQPARVPGVPDVPDLPVEVAPAFSGAPVQVLAFDLDQNTVLTLSREASGRPTREPSEFLVNPAVHDLPVYSVESIEVEPPVAVRPQLPTELPAGMTRENLIAIEVVVSPAGTVDAVKLLGESRYISEGLWLSAIKAWQFRPALKDGDAVKYKKTVWIAARP